MTGRRIHEPTYGYTLTVPTHTAAGAAVTFSSDTTEAGHRFHAASPDVHEVYLEVVAFPERLDHTTATEGQRWSLAERASAASFGPRTRGVLAGRPAMLLDVDVVLDGQRKIRRFIHVDVGQRTLRIVVDPSSPTNLAALDSIELLDPPS